MARFVKGEIVILPFPYTDLTITKRRPAVVLAPASPHDLVVCMIVGHMQAAKLTELLNAVTAFLQR